MQVDGSNVKKLEEERNQMKTDIMELKRLVRTVHELERRQMIIVDYVRRQTGRPNEMYEFLLENGWNIGKDTF